MSAADVDRPIVLAAGGTGGHMFPAEALAQELKRRGRRVLLVTDERGQRYTKNFPADDQFLISAATPSSGGPIAKGLAALSIVQGLMTARREFKKYRPVAAVGFGGYPSLPAMKAIAWMGVPYGIHEQNGVLGRTNRLLAKGAAFTAHAFPVLEKLPAGITGIEVGNPLRDAVQSVSDIAFEDVSADGKINILIFGGSQGASIFAKAPVKAIAGLPDEIRTHLMVTHQARENDLESVRHQYSAAGVEAEVAPFFNDLPARMAAAHLILSRAGASTVTELSAIGRPSILVPLGIAMDDHQTGNANVLTRDFSGAKGAILLPETEFNEDRLSAVMAPLLKRPDQLKAMAIAAKGRVKSGAAATLADLVEGIVRSPEPS